MPFIADTGLRIGEVAGLRWRDVDTWNGTVNVREVLVEVRGKAVFGPPKIAAGRRTVPTSTREVGERLDPSRVSGCTRAARAFVQVTGWALVSARRDLRAARRFFATALGAHGEPVEVVTDRAPALRAAIERLIPAAFHNTEQYANNRGECDHRRLKARLRPMRGLKRDHSAQVIIRRGHYELGTDARAHRRIEHAFTELARTI